MPPAATLTIPQTPSRSRSASQPNVASIPEDAALDTTPRRLAAHSATVRSHSSNSVRAPNPFQPTPNADSPSLRASKGRARSSSLVTVTEVGGDDPDNVVDRLGAGNNENAAWVNAPGAWLIHPVLICCGKLLIDAIPGMTQDVSWTIVNLSYITFSFIMFHHVTGLPFESTMSTSGAYDDLTLWEQIDSGAQYTPAKKWLTSVPILLFLISTHYTRYDYVLFALNFAALIFVLFPKLPILHRLRFHFTVNNATDIPSTPNPSRPPSPSIHRSITTR
ncbi:hypothetical protein B9479_002880 [Cryptococcus floricola]|uniref:Uncharacterized protein n=1 Tax=Cryptococcus floricola TaxID=2591691 RepID=A0A5D3AYB0_9TREE|nr:hypothetical protein B9479_002880 [Cryptococcus floricola]